MRRRTTFSAGWALLAYRVVYLPLTALVYVGIGWIAVRVQSLLSGTTVGLVFWLAWIALLVKAPHVLIVPAILVSQLVGRGVRVLEQRWQQRKRDLVADERQRAGESFSLYLRSFTSTGRVPILLRRHQSTVELPVIRSIKKFDDGVLGDLETTLAEVLEPVAPLLALGRPGEHIGAGRIEVQDSVWQLEFQRLAEDAKHIVVVPSTHEGTMWELREISSRSSWLAKTTFIVPPSLPAISYDHGVGLKDDLSFRDAQDDAVAALKQMGISLESLLPPPTRGRWSSTGDVRLRDGLCLALGRADNQFVIRGRWPVCVPHRRFLDGKDTTRLSFEHLRSVVARSDPGR